MINKDVRDYIHDILIAIDEVVKKELPTLKPLITSINLRNKS